jgi:hypothetical protein
MTKLMMNMRVLVICSCLSNAVRGRGGAKAAFLRQIKELHKITTLVLYSRFELVNQSTGFEFYSIKSTTNAMSLDTPPLRHIFLD